MRWISSPQAPTNASYPGGCRWLHRELVYASGALEIAGGLGLLNERTRRVAGIGLLLPLVAVWPANVEMLLDAQGDKKPTWWLALLWTRLPVQLVLITWVWRASRPRT